MLPNSFTWGSEAEFAAGYPFLADARDRATFLAHALRVALYQPPSAGRRPSGVGAKRQVRVC